MKKYILLILLILLSDVLLAQREIPFCPAPVISAREPEAAPLTNMIPLSSNPGGRKVIFMDFDGEASLTSLAWGLENKYIAPANMTIENAIEAYNITKEDYIFTDVNITTDQAVYDAALPSQRVRLYITETSDFYPYNAGGVAYVTSFTWGDNTPAFIFSARLGNYGKYVGECTSHESGHTLGLQHQSRWVNGVKTESYHSGTGVLGTDIHWSPIMGVSYYGRNTTWTVGTSTYAEYQDDTLIIFSQNGLVRRQPEPNVIMPYTRKIVNFTLTNQSLVTIRVRSGDNTNIKLKLGNFENDVPDSLDSRLESLTLPAGIHSLEVIPTPTINNPTGYGNWGQFFLKYEITPITIVPLDTTTRYIPERPKGELWYTQTTIFFKSSISERYILFTIDGRIVKQGRYFPRINQIDISTLPPGNYVLKTDEYKGDVIVKRSW